MRIFITGATGHIGQRVMARLLNQGHEIHALCRRKPDGELFNNCRVKIFKKVSELHFLLSEYPCR